jgi:hypothetical protein
VHNETLANCRVGVAMKEGIAPYVKVVVVRSMRLLFDPHVGRVFSYCPKAGLVDVARGAFHIGMDYLCTVVGEVMSLELVSSGLSSSMLKVSAWASLPSSVDSVASGGLDCC